MAQSRFFFPETATPNLEPRAWEAAVDRARAARTVVPGLPSLDELAGLDRACCFAELGYTFWNRELVDALAARCRGLGISRWVELAAGNGRCTLELVRRGLDVAATDDYSQTPDRVIGAQRPIRYGEWVLPLAARDAVAVLEPEAVLCAWPPLGSGLVMDLLENRWLGTEGLSVLLCIGEPGGATEAPVPPQPMPPGWQLETWADCERYLAGFNDPPFGPGWRSYSRILVYRRNLA